MEPEDEIEQLLQENRELAVAIKTCQPEELESLIDRLKKNSEMGGRAVERLCEKYFGPNPFGRQR
jgi:hypothetical protein